MKITKIFHSCILIENNVKILMDPGTWVFEENYAKPSDFADVNAVLITHQDIDHCSLAAIPEIVKNGAEVITNQQVAKKLKEVGVNAKVVSPNNTLNIADISVRILDCPHGITPKAPPENIGFIIDEKIFNPGDSISNTKVTYIEVLFVPITAPWSKLVEVIEFVKAVKPRIAVPIHDGFMKYPFTLNTFSSVVTELGIEVKAKNPGESFEI